MKKICLTFAIFFIPFLAFSQSVEDLLKRLNNVEETLKELKKRPKVTNTIVKDDKLPVGTIITSIFGYEEFCKLNSYILDGKLPDLKKVEWVPADGRSVVGSKFSQYKTNVPDLRGVFLRGLNKFYESGEGNTDVSKLDPDGLRIVGSYQDDSFESHNHGVTDKGHTHPLEMHDAGSGGLGKSGGDNRPFLTDHNTEVAYTGISIQESGGKETRPKNIAVYYYIKIN